MADSALVTKYIPAYVGNYTKNRLQFSTIKEITVHHTGATGNTIDTLGRLWQTRGRNGSSHYGVCNNEVGQYVLERDVAWTNSNWNANCRAVTIEVANSAGAPNWPISDASFETLVKLVYDIAKRNNLLPLVLGKNLTYHSMYTATLCPGPYLKGKLPELIKRVNAMDKPVVPDVSGDLINGEAIITVGPASKGDVNSMRALANSLGLGFKETNGLMEIGPASKGDQQQVLILAKQLQLPYTVEKYPKDEYIVTVEGFRNEAAVKSFVSQCEGMKLNAKASLKTKSAGKKTVVNSR